MKNNSIFRTNKERNHRNSSGVIIGTPGTGKTYLARKEIINILETTKDYVYIIDPEGEYTDFINSLGGQEIKIDSKSNNYINIMDINLEYSFGDTGQIYFKSDFILALFNNISQNKNLLINTFIDNHLKNFYYNYFQDLKNNNVLYNNEKNPTLYDFDEFLAYQNDTNIELLREHTNNLLNDLPEVFLRKTNIEIKNRLVSFNLKDLGHKLRPIGYLATLDFIWNKVTINYSTNNNYNWLYIDEIYPLINNETNCIYLNFIWRGTRPYRLNPMAITQATEDVLSSEARSIIANSNFIYILPQYLKDKEELIKMFNLKELDNKYLDYITQSTEQSIDNPYGRGILINSWDYIPFTKNDY